MAFYTFDKITHFKSSLRDGISAIYLNIILRRFALSLVGLFVPVYLFTKGQEIWGESITNGFGLILIYYTFWVITKLTLLVPVANLIVSAGYRWTITLSNLFWMLLLAIFYFSEDFIGLLFLAPFIHAFATTLYWLSYHSLFAEDGHIKHLGREVGASQLIGLASSILGPILGGVIIDRSGFSSLFLIALFVIALSGFPFFFLPHHRAKSKVNLGDVFSWIRNKDHLNEVISVFGRNFEEKVSLILWPVFVFLIVENYTKQGMIASVSTFFGAFAVYLAGKFMDKKGNRRRFLIGALGTGVVWVLRSFARGFFGVFMIDIASSIIMPFYWVNFESILYKDARSKSENELLFMTSRLFVTGFSYLTVLFFLSVFMGTPHFFKIMFFLAGVGAILSFSLWERKT